MSSKIFLLFCFLVLASCSQGQKHTRSFYNWKFSYSTDDSTVRTIKKLGVEHFYVHFLDVDWSENAGTPIPVGQLQTYRADAFTLGNYTPVIFITNRVFERMPATWNDTLVEKITGKITETVKRINYDSISTYLYNTSNYYSLTEWQRDSTGNVAAQRFVDKLDEIQIDCDWTAGTKDKYFTFLKALKKRYPEKTISVTLGLYPYKYRKETGIPPVDKAVLMCYNMGNIQKPGTQNSIFSLNELSQYLIDKQYPLPLDVALPIFGWHVWFRGDKLKGIIYETPELTTLPAFSKVNADNYTVVKDTVVSSNYLREGDVLRLEYPDPAELGKAAALIDEKVQNYNRLIFYHWDTSLINRYENTILDIYSKH